MEADILVETHGSIYLVSGITAKGGLWLEEHVEDALTLGSSVACECRYIGSLVEGILQDGLTVQDGVTGCLL